MELAQKLLEILFPSRCIVCYRTIQKTSDNQSVELCLDCHLQLPKNENCCKRCALPLPLEISSEVLCGRCIKELPQFDYCYSPFKYESDIIQIVQQLKFKDKIINSRSIGEMLYRTFNDDILPVHGKPDCLVPVPLHKKRLRQRGYNQSIEIARVLSNKLQVNIAHDLVIRSKVSIAQQGLSAKKRQKNIKGVFEVHETKNYEHVLIIDDVMTTGSTVNELAKTLKKGGVKDAGVLSFARAPLKN